MALAEDQVIQREEQALLALKMVRVWQCGVASKI